MPMLVIIFSTQPASSLHPLLQQYQGQRLGDGEDDLAVRDIQHKLLLHPFSPFLKPLGMAGGAEPTGAAGKVEKEFSIAVSATNPGKSALGIASVQIALHNFFYETKLSASLCQQK